MLVSVSRAVQSLCKTLTTVKSARSWLASFSAVIGALPLVEDIWLLAVFTMSLSPAMIACRTNEILLSMYTRTIDAYWIWALPN